MKLIPLSNGGFTKVSDRDYPMLKVHRWRSRHEKHTSYAFTVKRISSTKLKYILMHRFILGLQTGEKLVVDHKNHDGLDNRRSNIRICTQGENLLNRRPSINPPLTIP